MKTIRSNAMRTVYMVAVGISFLLSSCIPESSVDVNQDKIYTIYEQFYDANTDKTTVIAAFRFGGITGTTLELDSTDFVTFNGEVLPYNIFYAGHALEYAGQLPPGVFSYTNLDGQTFVNSVPAMDTIAFPTDFDTIVRSQANELEWVGNPLAANESVGFFVGSWTWGQDALYLQESDGSSSIVLGTVQLSNVPVGPSICVMDRANTVEVGQGTPEGGAITAKYRAANKTVQVVN